MRVVSVLKHLFQPNESMILGSSHRRAKSLYETHSRDDEGGNMNRPC